MPLPNTPASGTQRWPPLLLALRRAARPDRARVAAYIGLTQRPAGWSVYAEFLAAHRAWIASLGGTLAAAGVNAPGPLPDAADPAEAGAAAPAAGAEVAPLPPPGTRAAALGYLYVFEAFRLGCSVLARRIRGKTEARADLDPWDELAAALAAVPAEEHPAAVQSAKDAFVAWERRLAGPLGGLGIGSASGKANAA